MKLNLKQGQGYTLYVSDDILQEDGIFYNSNQKALQAIEDILISAEKSEKASEDGHNIEDTEAKLYKYEKNIVAICGHRGAGKTSRMLSLSKALENCTEDSVHSYCCSHKKHEIEASFPHIAQANFEIVPPLDPTILTQEQTFLEVVLARIYNMIEEAWRAQNHMCPSSSGLEHTKDSVLECMQKCLIGIHGIYRKKEDYQSDTLAQLHTVSYGMQLKLLFYNLVKETLNLLCQLKGSRRQNSYLILQLDDTDCQVRHAYGIVEDLRRYLSIPNVIILMATDMSILHEVLTQTFYTDFKDYLDKFCSNPTDLGCSQSMTLAKKYLDKLIAPNHVIYLPTLDDIMLRNRQNLEIIYDGISGLDKDRDILKQEKEDYPNDCPTQILQFIQRKTGIIFISAPHEIHPLIPTTLRGYLQLMDMLYEMKDLPDVKASLDADPESFIQNYSQRLKIQRENVLEFFHYFMKVWAPVKLSNAQVLSLNKIKNVNPHLRTSTACREVRSILKAIGVSFNVDGNGNLRTDNYYNLVQSLWTLEKQEPEIRMFSFAVQCCLSCLYNLDILTEKEAALQRLVDDLQAEPVSQSFTVPQKTFYYLCDYDWTRYGLPDQFCLPQIQIATKQHAASPWDPDDDDSQCGIITPAFSKLFTEEEFHRHTSGAGLQQIFFHCQDNKYQFLLLGIVHIYLRLHRDFPEVKVLCENHTPDQLRQLQEFAAVFASNVEIQRFLYTHCENPLNAKNEIQNKDELFNVSPRSSQFIVFVYQHFDFLLRDFRKRKNQCAPICLVPCFLEMASSLIPEIADASCSNSSVPNPARMKSENLTTFYQRLSAFWDSPNTGYPHSAFSAFQDTHSSLPDLLKELKINIDVYNKAESSIAKAAKENPNGLSYENALRTNPAIAQLSINCIKTITSLVQLYQLDEKLAAQIKPTPYKPDPSRSRIDCAIYRKVVNVLCKQFNLDPEQFRANPDSKPKQTPASSLESPADTEHKEGESSK